MTLKKYQIFISSTFEDLKEERKAVEETIIRSGDIPVGMESFPAVDSEQFDFIKTIIDGCDFYVLILAGRYGTVGEKGLSYTEMEFDYAVHVGVPVLVFPRSDIEKLASFRVEPSPDGRARLAAFVERSSKGRLRKSWGTTDGLKLAVREAIDYAKATKPRPGWVRGDSVATVEILEEIEKVRKENSTLVARIGKPNVEIPVFELPALGVSVEVKLANSVKLVRIRGRWLDFLSAFYHGINQRRTYEQGEDFYYYDLDASLKGIAAHIEASILGVHSGDLSLSVDSFRVLKDYFLEAGLMNEDGRNPLFTDTGQLVARRNAIGTLNQTIYEVISGEISPVIPF